MGRLACVDVPALPLQWLARQHPEWRRHPMAVVADERPQSRLLYANEQAYRCGVRPGQRYAAALSLARDLRAAPVPPMEVRACVACLAAELRRHTPDVEASDETPGVFWLNGHGLERLYEKPAAWAKALQSVTRRAGFTAAVVVGFTRFGTWAAARVRPAVCTVFPHADAEADAAGRVPLVRLDLDPSLRDVLDKLGIETVGDFVALPPYGVRERFGDAAYRLHRLASGDLWTPLQPQRVPEVLERFLALEPPEGDVETLLFRVKQLLDPLLVGLHARRQALTRLHLHLVLDNREEHDEHLGTAEPTLEVVQILQLVRLRLERLQLSDAVTDVHVAVDGAPAPPQQMEMFAEKQRRDRAAIGRACDRLRAEFGEDAVVHATLRDGHLPIATFQFSDTRLSPNLISGTIECRQINRVRRIYQPPIPLPLVKRQGDDGWLLCGHEGGSVLHLWGPYRISGGWWQHEVEREYYYAEMKRGELLWVFYDQHRRRWFLQGRVE